MRLSNVFIYGSVAIIVASSLGFLIYKSIPKQKSGDSSKLAERIKELEKENSDLLEQSGQAIQKFSDKITSLNNDLLRSSRLVTEKDLEISQLKSQLDSDTLAGKLATMLNCRPAEVPVTVNQLINEYQTLDRKLKLVNGQLAKQMSQGNQTDPTSKSPAKPASNETSSRSNPPRIKKLELSAPANQWAKGNRNPDSSNNESNQPKTPDVANQSGSGTKGRVQNVAADPPIGKGDATELVNQLTSQIETLKVELRNREKLLSAQTSLIEDLKKKSRIETGFRTVENGRIVEPARPFRDVGTFPVQIQK